jgi:putative CRISPR-associated protein (TIGR02619 family)
MRDILICTVGTSLIGNLQKSGDPVIAASLDRRNSKALALDILSKDPDDRICGAEINSVNSIIGKRMLDERRILLLLLSDTADGRFTGEILRGYFGSAKCPIAFERVEERVVEGLTDADVKRFKNDGLRNLVRIIAETARNFGAARMLINATGGYKAQISFAGMIGQALKISVCYLFERFSEVIALPPQPVALDLSFWLDNSDLFFELESGLEGEGLVSHRDERFKALVDDIEEDGVTLQALTAVGQLLHESSWNSFNQNKHGLLPRGTHVPIEKRAIRLEDQNGGKHKGLEAFLRRVVQVEYVNGVYTHYFNPDLSRRISFRKSSKGIPGQVEGCFCNDGALTKFDVMTTAETEDQVKAAIADLNSRFC